MDKFVLLVLACIIIFFLVIYVFYKMYIIAKREKLIDIFKLPSSINKKILEKYPHLTEAQAAQVVGCLREYFHLCNAAGNKMVSMPSQVVDLAWHEFILFTRKYEYFCNSALGRFLHHTPAEAMASPTVAQEGIKIAWKISCEREKIQPKSAHKLPLLFAIDSLLKIPDGFNYSINCLAANSNEYCAGHIDCISGLGGCAGDSSGCGGCGSG